MGFKIFEWRSLKTRVTLLTLVIFLLTIWSLAFYASRIMQNETKRMIGEQEFSTASIVADQVNDELNERLRTLNKIAKKITPSAMSNPATMESLLDQHQQFQDLFNAGTFVTGVDGTAIASLSIDRVGAKYIDRDYVLAALKEGKTTVGRPVIGKHQKTPVFSMATPILDTQGAVMGALVGVTNLSKPNFLDKITNSSYGRTGGYILCAPRHRLIVTATDKNRIMQATPEPGINPLYDRYAQGFEGYGQAVNSLGVEELTASKQIPVAGWLVVTKIPTAEAFAPIYIMQQQVFVATILLTLLSGGLIWLMLRRQISPLITATNLLETHSYADLLPQTLPVIRQDEIGKLITSFNRLLESLGAREKALLESEERYRSLFTRASDGIFILSTEGKLIDVNESLARMHGYTVQEMLQIDLKDLDTPETFRLVPERFQRLLAGESLTFNVEHYHKDGHIFPLEVSSSLFSFGGKFYIQCFHRDITEKQKSAQDKERLELQLQQSQRLESVGRLAGGVAHDFNNLLSVISGYSELGLFETHREDLLHDFFLNIHNSAVKSADLTKQLLAFARQQTTMPIVLDLNITITGMLKMLKRLIGENINLEWKASTDLWSVKIDPSQVDQILVNLCVNARDAILSEGTIIIEASNCVVVEHLDCIATDLAPDGYIKLTVSDNGGGIEKEVLEHIFEPFYTTKDIGKGTGLGLATIYGIVKQNHGFIDVSSEPGYGTKFIIYLPRCDSEPEAEQTGDNDLCFPTGNETILLVEDEFDILMMAKLILVKQGYVLLQANSPDEALRIVDEYHGTIHLLISDVIMPTMNGKDLAATLLALYPQIKSLFMSGYTADIIGKYGVLDEGINFIQKPFSIKELSTKVRHVLDA